MVICDRLKRVVEVAQGIDDGHGAVLRKVGYVVVGVHSGDDSPRHAANDHAGIVERFVDAELDILGAEEHGVATEKSNCSFAGDTSSGGSFGEHYSDRFGEEAVLKVGWSLARLDAGLVFGGIADKSGELLGREIVYGEKVSWAKWRCRGL